MMLEKLFGFDRKVTSVRTEVIAGITTFLTMAYILAVNPNVLSATGMDKGALFTTTVVASAFATLLMAFYAKLPFSLAPGIGLSTFFAYTGLPDDGLYLAVRAYGRLDRRHHLYSAHGFQSA